MSYFHKESVCSTQTVQRTEDCTPKMVEMSYLKIKMEDATEKIEKLSGEITDKQKELVEKKLEIIQLGEEIPVEEDNYIKKLMKTRLMQIKHDVRYLEGHIPRLEKERDEEIESLEKMRAKKKLLSSKVN